MSDQNELLLLVADESGAWTTKNAGALRRTWNNLKKEWQGAGRGLNEMMSPARMISEKFFSGYGEHMNHLRKVDNEIQSWLYDLDNCLDEANDARKSGRLLDVVFWLGQINDRLRLASRRGQEVIDIHEEQIRQFEGNHKQKLPADFFSEDKIQDRLVRASVGEDFKQWMTNWKMQRVYKERLAKRKLAANDLYSKAKVVVTVVEKLLGVMADARASGKIAEYMKAISEISKQQNDFQTEFKVIYAENFADMGGALRERGAELQKEQAAKGQQSDKPAADGAQPPVLPDLAPVPDLEYPKPEPKRLELLMQPRERNRPRNEVSMDVPALEPQPEAQPIQESAPAPVEQVMLPLQRIPAMPPIPKLRVVDTSSPAEDLPEPDSTEIKPKPQPQIENVTTAEVAMIDQILQKKANVEFFAELQKAAASEDPYLLAAMVAKFSGDIEDTDPETSMKLLAIAEGFLDV